MEAVPDALEDLVIRSEYIFDLPCNLFPNSLMQLAILCHSFSNCFSKQTIRIFRADKE